MPGEMIRVVLADDHAIVRVGLRAILQSAGGIQIVGEASNGGEVIALVGQLDPDVVVMDLEMPGIDGVAATRMLVAARLRACVLVLTMHADEIHRRAALEAGAAGYVVKSHSDRDLVAAVRAAAAGEVTARPFARQAIRYEGASDRQRYEQLTERERAVLRLVGQGFSALEIGHRLLISPKTVETYKARIQEKLNFTHRADYVQLALRLGLLTH